MPSGANVGRITSIQPSGVADDKDESPIEPAGRGRTGHNRKRSGKAIFLGPLVALLAVLVAVPALAIFIGAMRDEPLGEPGGTIGFQVLADTYTDVGYLTSLGGTVLLSVAVGLFATVIGSAFAWLMSRTDIPFRGALELGVIAPLFLSPFVGAIAWVTLAAPGSGLLNVNLRHLFGDDFTLVDIRTTAGLLAILVIYYIPYGYLFVSASLKNMDPALEDASHINGFGTIRTAMRVTFPVIRPAMSASFFFIAVLSAGVFSVPGVIGLGGSAFRPFAVEIYRAIGVFPSDYATGAALGTMLLLITAVGIYFYRRSIANVGRYVTISARGYRPRLISLGGWRFGIAGIVLLYLLLAIILPYAALIIVSLTPFAMTDITQLSLSIDNFVNVASSGAVQVATRNTIYLGVASATLCVLLGLLVAFGTQRYRGRLAGFADYLATFPIAIPGIVFATGMIWVYVWTPVYGTIYLLMIAYIASYVPHTARLAGNGLMQLDKSLEEASTINGASGGRTLGRITFPLVRPSLLSGWVLVFIFTVRELNTAIVLYSPTSAVLSVLTWSYVEGGTIRNAAVVGIIQSLLLIAGLIVARFVFRVRLSSVA